MDGLMSKIEMLKYDATKLSYKLVSHWVLVIGAQDALEAHIRLRDEYGESLRYVSPQMVPLTVEHIPADGIVLTL